MVVVEGGGGEEARRDPAEKEDRRRKKEEMRLSRGDLISQKAFYLVGENMENLPKNTV